jgi:hypothetical protein
MSPTRSGESYHVLPQWTAIFRAGSRRVKAVCEDGTFHSENPDPTQKVGSTRDILGLWFVGMHSCVVLHPRLCGLYSRRQDEAAPVTRSLEHTQKEKQSQAWVLEER